MFACCTPKATPRQRTAATSPRRPSTASPPRSAPLEVEVAAPRPGLWSSQRQQSIAETPRNNEGGSWQWIDVAESKTPSPRRRDESPAPSPGPSHRSTSTSFSGDDELDDTNYSGRIVRRSTSRGDVELYQPRSPKPAPKSADESEAAGDLRRLMLRTSEDDMALYSEDEDEDEAIRRRSWGVSASWGDESVADVERAELDGTNYDGRPVTSTSFADVGALERTTDHLSGVANGMGGLSAQFARAAASKKAPEPINDDEGLDNSLHDSRSGGQRIDDRGFALLTRRSSSVPTIGGEAPPPRVNGRVRFGEPLVKGISCFEPASTKERAATWYTRAEYRSIRDAAWFIESLDVVRDLGDDAPSAPATAFGESRRGLCDDDTTKKRLARIRAVRFAVASASRHGLPADVVARLAATPDAALQAVEHAREDREAALACDEAEADQVPAEPPRVDRAAVMKLLQDHRGAFGIAPLVRKDSFSRLEDAASQSPPPEATAAATAAARYRHALRLYSSTRARSAPAERG